jgi:hypothetical protein
MKLKRILNEVLRESNLNANFKKWFGNSKVTDGSKPKIYYHGTNIDFDKFDISKKRSGWLSKGFYFTEHKNDAKTYGSKILSVYLSVKNPFIIKSDVANTDGTVEWAKEKKEQIYEIIPDAKGVPWEDVSNLLEKNGYDGFIWGNWVVTFNPNQIKSVENDGSWDENDANIYS